MCGVGVEGEGGIGKGAHIIFAVFVASLETHVKSNTVQVDIQRRYV